MEGNISDVWSKRKTVLTVQDVEKAMRSIILNQHIPITQKPNANTKISLGSKDIEKCEFRLRKFCGKVR